MQEIELTSTQYILLGTAFGALFGLLLGMIPFFIGKRLNNQKIAKLALLVGPVAGALLGAPGAILSAVIFSIVIVVRRNQHGNVPEHYDGNADFEK